MTWWKNVKLWLLVAAAFALSILVWVLRGLFSKGPTVASNPEDPGFGGLPPAPAVIQDAADAAFDSAQEIKAGTKAKTEAELAELQRIAAIAERKARRKAYSDFINRN